MTLLETIETLPADDYLYIGLASGSGFVTIERNKDFDPEVLNKRMETRRPLLTSILEEAKEDLEISLGRHPKTKRDQKKEEERQQIARETINHCEELLKIPFCDREVVETYSRWADPERMGKVLLIDGVESICGIWYVGDERRMAW